MPPDVGVEGAVPSGAVGLPPVGLTMGLMAGDDDAGPTVDDVGDDGFVVVSASPHVPNLSHPRSSTI